MKCALILPTNYRCFVGKGNPSLRAEELQRADELFGKMDSCHEVISGTGKHHWQLAFNAIRYWEPNRLAQKYSIFCGTADFACEDNTVLLADGITVPSVDFLRVGVEYINTHLFIKGIADHSLVIADQQFMIALGFGVILRPGMHLYELTNDSTAACLTA